MAQLNFNQFFNLLNGEPYTDIPAPVSYNFQDYTNQITSSPVNNREDSGGWQLRPLGFDDMAQASGEDVCKHLLHLRKQGHNPTRLGNPLSDEEFKNYTGQTW